MCCRSASQGGPHLSATCDRLTCLIQQPAQIYPRGTVHISLHISNHHLLRSWIYHNKKQTNKKMIFWPCSLVIQRVAELSHVSLSSRIFFRDLNSWFFWFLSNTFSTVYLAASSTSSLPWKSRDSTSSSWGWWRPVPARARRRVSRTAMMVHCYRVETRKWWCYSSRFALYRLFGADLQFLFATNMWGESQHIVTVIWVMIAGGWPG